MTTVQAEEQIGGLLPAEEEARLLWRLGARIAGRTAIQAMAQSRLRAVLILSMTLVFWIGLYGLFYNGFRFMTESFGPPGSVYHAQTVRFVFHLFFASLQIMLIFSTGLIFYSSLYRSNETTFLLTQPIRPTRIVAYKAMESILFSTWGFLLLGTPMLIAYGMVIAAPVVYYVLLFPLLAAFAYIPCAVGHLLTLLIASWLPRWRRVIVPALGIALLAVAAWVCWLTFFDRDVRLFGPQWFRDTFRRFQFTRGEWLPSTWLTNALLDAARTDETALGSPPWLESFKYLGTLIANALLLQWLVAMIGGAVLRRSRSRLAGRTSGQVRQRARSEKIARALLRPLPLRLRLLVFKDIKLFVRDPIQWLQFTIFFGLLAIYFANIERFDFGMSKSSAAHTAWVNLVSFLNVVVVGLILSTFTTRFIYPLISLEGKRFWVLEMLPLGRDALVWSKLAFSVGGTYFPCALLVLLSDAMLDVSWKIIVTHQVAALALTLGLSALAVGMGAAMPNLREESPAKIAAGFGGTLCLVVSALYIMAIAAVTSMPVHFEAVQQRGAIRVAWLANVDWAFWSKVGLVATPVVVLLGTWLPLLSGIRRFRELEA